MKEAEIKPQIPDLNVLTISISNVHQKNRIFEDYCHGIKSNSKNYYFIDYLELYLKTGNGALEKQIEEIVVTKKINCVFFILPSGDFTFDINFIERLSKQAFIVMNFLDPNIFFEIADRYYAQAADLTLLADYLIKYHYEILNIKAICTFSLFDKNYYKRFENRNKNIDVSFIGDVTREKRLEYIDFLRKNNVPIKTYGRGSEEGFIDFGQMIEIFNKSKININFTGVFNSNNLILGKNINNRVNVCNGRIIEIALCGGFILSEYSNGMEEMFKIGEEIEVFHTKEELLDKIKFYLTDDSQRNKIAERAYQRAIKDYDTSECFSKVFNAIAKIKKSNKIVYLDKDFFRNYTSYRFYYMTRFLLMGRLRIFFEELQIFCRFGKISFYQVYAYILKAITIHLDKYPQVKTKLKSCFKVFVRY